MNDVELASGREMDALVAEKVMGFVKNSIADAPGSCETIEIWSTPQRKRVVPDGSLPRFSTDIAAAWEVVDKLGGKFIALRKRADNRGWTVIVHQDDISGLTEEASADTAPLAICRAALKVAEENS